MGIGRPQHGSGADYVLSNFSQAETAELAFVVEKGADAVAALISDGADKAMNDFNRRAKAEPSP